MHLLSMLHISTIIVEIIFICALVNPLSIGRVNKTRFTSVDRLNKDSIWLSDFATESECVCAVLSSNFSSMATALNVYRNGSCQLFLTLPLSYTMETNDNSTLVLLKQLPIENLAPCCSNLSWLISKIRTSQLASASLNRSAFVIIDDNNFLVALSYKTAIFQLDRTTLNKNQLTTIGATSTSLSYRDGFYYIPNCSDQCRINILSTKNLSVVGNILLSSRVVREITFVRNHSLMLVASNDDNQILFFDVNTPKNYTPSTPSSINVNRPCGLYAVNDSFIYVASWVSSMSPTPISTLIYSNNTWILSPLTNTTPSSGEKYFQTTVDSCGRLWAAVTGYGIRIFDPWGRSLLYQWPVASGINGFLLLDNYELFVADFEGNQILHFNPNITQCTS